MFCAIMEAKAATRSNDRQRGAQLDRIYSYTGTRANTLHQCIDTLAKEMLERHEATRNMVVDTLREANLYTEVIRDNANSRLDWITEQLPSGKDAKAQTHSDTMKNHVADAFRYGFSALKVSPELEAFSPMAKDTEQAYIQLHQKFHRLLDHLKLDIVTRPQHMEVIDYSESVGIDRSPGFANSLNSGSTAKAKPRKR